jgi:hypothetical protein
MVDVRNQTRGGQKPQDDKPQAPLNPRFARRNRRLQVLKDARPVDAGVHVVPTNEAHRAVLKHIPSGVGFRDSGHAVWPNDRFTQRRLRDGSVKLHKEKESPTQETTATRGATHSERTPPPART